jgi:aminocarboxymuconate-semialdehyde decarboxylase
MPTNGIPAHVDVHAHYLAPSVVEAISSGEFEPHVRILDSPEGLRLKFPTTVSRPLMPAMTDLDERLVHLDERGLDVQVLSPWIDTFGYDLPQEVAIQYHAKLNEGMAEAVRAFPDRFRFFASVPLPWGAAAASALTDAVGRLGAVGSMIGTNVAGRPLDDPHFGPLWETSAQLGVPVELHPVDVAGQDRLDRYQLDNFLGNPFDTTIAATSLMFGGVLDRYPDLDVVLLHGGGYFPYAVGRLDHGRKARGVARKLKQAPAEYLQRFYYDTIVYDATALETLARLVGVDRLLIGSDYPFDMEPDEILSTLMAALGAPGMDVLARTARRLARI